MRPRTWTGWAVVAATLLIPAGGLWLAAREWYPQVLSHHGEGIKRMLDYTLVVTGAIFVVGHLVLAWLVVRALRRPSGPQAVPSARAQRLVGIVPAVLMALVAEGGVMALGLPVWGEYYGDAPDDAVRVEVVGRQFFWAVRYPGADGAWGRTETDLVSIDNAIGLDVGDPAARDDVVLLNEIHLPKGRPMAVVGGTLALLIRLQLAYPAEAWPLLESLMPDAWEGGYMKPEFYLSLVTMHGTIMVFFVVSLALVSGFGNFIIPLQIGARDMAFPFVGSSSATPSRTSTSTTRTSWSVTSTS